MIEQKLDFNDNFDDNIKLKFPKCIAVKHYRVTLYSLNNDDLIIFILI
jgi:hypothetical protein